MKKLQSLRTIMVTVKVPARGDTGLHYETPSSLFFDDPRVRRARYAPAETKEVVIVDLPPGVSSEAAQEATQAILSRGGGFQSPVLWRTLEGGLKRFGLRVVQEDGKEKKK